MDLTAEEDLFLVQTACWTIRRRLEGATAPMAVMPISPAVIRPAGVFASLHRRQGHALRGCIGRVDSASPLLESLINIAWGVAQDPRFAGQPVTLAELPELTVELSILGQLKPAANPMDFNPQTDGIYLSVSGRTGIFLPQVARETGWPKAQLLDRLSQEKLGLPQTAWRQPSARLFTVPTRIIGPMDFIMDVQLKPFDPMAPRSTI
jgi:AmmeMemoRadiSam system protein A